MYNNIPEFDSVTDLIEEDPSNNFNQARICLSIDWEHQEIDVETYRKIDGTPGDVWHGLRALIALPDNVNPRHLKKDVDEILSTIEKIHSGYSSEWIDESVRGIFTDECQQQLSALEYNIKNNPSHYFHLFENGGLWDAEEWFCDPIEEIFFSTTDDEIEMLAKSYNEDAELDGVIIKGGYDAIIDHFRNQRDEMKIS